MHRITYSPDAKLLRSKKVVISIVPKSKKSQIPSGFLDLTKQIKLSNLLTKNQVVTLNQTIPHEGHQAFAKRYLNNSREATFYRLKTEVYHHDSRLETTH